MSIFLPQFFNPILDECEENVFVYMVDFQIFHHFQQLHRAMP
jgi:hypothetical protein